jgi:hypothetical protein
MWHFQFSVECMFFLNYELFFHFKLHVFFLFVVVHDTHITFIFGNEPFIFHVDPSVTYSNVKCMRSKWDLSKNH